MKRSKPKPDAFSYAKMGTLATETAIFSGSF